MIGSRNDGKCELKKKYKINAKSFDAVIEELQQRISARILKLKH